MSDKKLDISKWKEDYHFFYTIWDTYIELDKSVEGDRYKSRYETVCDLFMQPLDEKKEEHRKFCLKLIRNLGHYSENLKILKFKSEDCNNLNNWVYSSKKEYNVPDEIITECFNDFKRNMNGAGIYDICNYYSYEDNYKEPINIIILDIFQSNMNIVTDLVASVNDIINFGLQKYICDCVHIYKEMDKKYCRGNYHGDLVRTLTCNTLNTFKTTYNSYLYEKAHNNYKIPSLDVDNEYADKCLASKLKLPFNSPVADDGPASTSLGMDIDERKSEYSPPSNFIGETPSSSMSRTVSTAVGTMAGASSILALLYKVTQIFI
ncbi:hypothetical protein PVBG_04796 [Plasmodium vivax Brazil I]|uniref:Uncharacterized protein n=1 Tax=Plasmodium vivax (strain Brazil I) TaxID=1033975 RepID=A0A0J9T1V9_PLAV1|nr:hypothetical protein PVBG_04796 [Plasmodium vivax Brazil I]